jgi:uncharacterized phage protein gp47/JayE
MQMIAQRIEHGDARIEMNFMDRAVDVEPHRHGGSSPCGRHVTAPSGRVGGHSNQGSSASYDFSPGDHACPV